MTTIYIPKKLMKYEEQIRREIEENCVDCEIEIVEGEYIFIEDAYICDQFNIFEAIYNQYERINPWE